MKKLKVKFENCFGINRLEKEFDFTTKNAYVIYAPNGTMKTSFAKTFEEYANPKGKIEDRIYNKLSSWKIKDENDVAVEANEIFVINSEISEYDEKDPKVTTLLVNPTLQKEYKAIHKNIKDKEKSVMDILLKKSGLKNTPANPELEMTISMQGKTFLESLINLKGRVIGKEDFKYLQNIQYSDIFNKDTEKLLKDEKVKEYLKLYMDNYKKLLSTNKIFVGSFDDKNALNTALALDNNGFFDGGMHKVVLSGQNEIIKPGKLEEIIKTLQAKAYSETEIKESIDEVAKKIQATKNTNIFKSRLKEHPYLIEMLLNNIDELKNIFWIAYLQENKFLYLELVETYEQSQEKIDAIFLKANLEKSEWKKVLKEFECRFTVPFTLDIQKPKDCILGINKAPSLVFKFDDKRVEKKELIDVLSRGERRAFYLLNILFEIKTKKEVGKEVLLIVDDIADSFDYQNKYAIIEYLKELSEDGLFKMLILTHNFDFFRTVVSRLRLKGDYNLYSIRTNNQIKLERPIYQGNIFETWIRWMNCKFESWEDPNEIKKQQSKILVALIPFARNLTEFKFCKSEEKYNEKHGLNASCDYEAYKFFTALLHLKDISSQIDFEQLSKKLSSIITLLKKNFLDDVDIVQSKYSSFIDFIFKIADSITAQDSELALENKVVLAIAIRLKAEEFMQSKVDDKYKNGNQTYQLFKEYISNFKDGETYLVGDEVKNSLSILKSVNLITPENIHLNSFMYEPLLDIACLILINLYKDVKEMAVELSKMKPTAELANS